jgi:transcriptional regulator with XRE-family HTH domain
MNRPDTDTHAEPQAKVELKFYVEKVSDGYTAHAPTRSILTEGDTLAEINANIKDALALQCEHLGISPDDFTIKLEYDLATFFEVYNVINVKALAERLGMNNTLISQYMSGKKEPSKKQKERIVTVLHQIGKELTQLSFA